MEKLKKLLAKGKALCQAIEDLEGKVAAEQDEAKRGELQTQLDGKSAEWETLEGQIQQAKAQQARQAVLDGLKVEPEGKTVSPEGDPPGGETDKIAAKARDHEKELREKHELFLDYTCAGRDDTDVLGKARRALAPVSPVMAKSERAQGGVVMPSTMFVQVFGKSVARMFPNHAKAVSIPMLSTDATLSPLVPQDYRRQLLELAAEEPHILPRCTVVPSPTGTVVWPMLTQSDSSEYGAVSVTWQEEGASKTATDADFEQVTISTAEVAAYTELSLTLLRRSAIDLEALVGRLFRDATLDSVDNKLINGSGVGEPLGIINTTGIHAVNRNTVSTVKFEDLVELIFALQGYHRAGATFICADGAMRVFTLTKDSDGRPLFIPSVAGTVPDRLVGYPYIGTHRAPSMGSAGDLCFVDLREYIVAMEEEVVVKRSDHYKFRNNVAAFSVTMQVGGKLVQPRVCSYLKATTS